MVLSLILFALCLIVAFFQYLQGFLSAAISAILTAVAAVVALGWYEQVAPLLFNIKFYDQAASISLVVLFAVTYFVPRLICDSLVPGNIRMPFIVEKVGAAVMGILAGLLSTGVLAVAADALPFGTTVAMYSRFDTADKTGQYMGRFGQMQDTVLNDVVTADKLDPESADHLWFRQDDLVVGLENKVAGQGSLGTDQSFTAVHPDLLDELYAQRLGIQTGARHSAVTTEQNHAVDVSGVYTLQPSMSLPQIDGEAHEMRGDMALADTTVKTEPDQIVLIVRMTLLGKDLADESDNLLRFSAGAVRLVAGQPENSAPFKDYHPVATLDGKGVAVACRPDDFLFSEMAAGSRTLDFVFVVDRDHVMSGEESKPPFHLPQGSFVEFKRYSIVDLSGKTVEYGPPPNRDKTPLLRKAGVKTALDKTEGIWSGGAAPTAAENSQNPSSGENVGAVGGRVLGESGLSYVDIKTSNKLAAPINAGTGNDSGTVQLSSGVSGELVHRQWQRLGVTSDTPIKQLGTPIDDNIQELAVRPNNVLVQVHCMAPTTGSASEMWAWSKRLSDFALADATGHTYKCVGAWARVQVRAQRYFVCNYQMNFDDQNHLQPFEPGKGRPVDVWLAFEVPAGTPIAEVRFSASAVMDNLEFKAE
ncbi:MAG: CvpA family protein [Tepidisphaeraceae bacterium]